MRTITKLLTALSIAALAACGGSQSPDTTNGNGTTGTGGAGTGNITTGTGGGAAYKSAAPAKVAEVEGISEYTLDNGMRILLFPDDSSEKITVNITYFVGSRHEGAGEGGMAHLLEHMVFKGTPDRPDIWNLLKNHGAQFNGTTWLDRTNYYETLPSNDENLEFAIAMEADRMINSNIDQGELSKEFSVVRNEFEMGENSPFGVLMKRMSNIAFLWHNYGKSTIGNKSDIEKVPAKTLRKFYEKYYQPDNAMLVVAGKFDEAKALQLVHDNFGTIPRPERELEPTYTIEPTQDGERQVILRRTGDTGVVGLMYHAVPGPHEDFIALEAAAHVLTDEPSGRLYKAIVETGMATSVSGFAFPTKEPGMMMFFAEVPGDKPLEPVRDKMLELIEDMGKEPPSKADVDRFINRNKKDMELAMADSQLIAVQLTEFAAMGDWRLLFVMRDRLDKINADDVQRVSKDYFKRSNRTLGMFVPTKTPDRAPVPEQPDVVALTKDYAGGEKMAEGEEFLATIANIEKRPTRVELNHGMKVAMLDKQTRGDTVQAVLTMRFGTEKDLKGKTTAGGFVPDMLLRGTTSRTYQQLLDEFDRLKASVSFGAGGGMGPSSPGSLTVNIETVRDNMPEVVALVADILQNPSFPADQFKILKSEQLTGLDTAKSDPFSQGFLAMIRALSPYKKTDVRYVPTTVEEIARVKKLKLADVKKFHKTFYGASNAEMAIVGDFDADAVKAVLDKEFGSWKSPKKWKRIDSKFHKTAAADHIVDTPDKTMTLIALAHQIELRDDHADYAAVVMMAYILGGNASSRLLTRMRHDGGLSYGAGGAIQASPEDNVGAVFAYAILAPQNRDIGMRYMVEELEKMVKDGVTADELVEAQASYAKAQEGNLATDSYLLGQLTQGLYLGRTMQWTGDLHGKIAKLTVADVNAVAKKYIKTDQLAKVMAGDMSKEAKKTE
jgi:zinc protease